MDEFLHLTIRRLQERNFRMSLDGYNADRSKSSNETPSHLMYDLVLCEITIGDEGFRLKFGRNEQCAKVALSSEF